MDENFETIREAFKTAGIDVVTAEYSITEYSLNTNLSFKFSNLTEFLEFLELHAQEDFERVQHIKLLFIDAGVDPDNFFYVNFFEPKVAEL
ncbi:hypothetical protein FMM05_12075 [Flavobacterium zepuense]|uniref:Uncharacterized protein n=1 Tax=Flavobacterium zepuense TaxID=2593302 RepID=A0A552V087_9FLAO|nr:hypothetical protein [Flavobacterium zepuense]TRW23891.1 hypothetical protein FMM05_12075 [Flavobacterium zepuense]